MVTDDEGVHLAAKFLERFDNAEDMCSRPAGFRLWVG
jgi:hypothetical protein